WRWERDPHLPLREPAARARGVAAERTRPPGRAAVPGLRRPGDVLLAGPTRCEMICRQGPQNCCRPESVIRFSVEFEISTMMGRASDVLGGNGASAWMRPHGPGFM